MFGQRGSQQTASPRCCSVPLQGYLPDAFTLARDPRDRSGSAIAHPITGSCSKNWRKKRQISGPAERCAPILQHEVEMARTMALKTVTCFGIQAGYLEAACLQSCRTLDLVTNGKSCWQPRRCDLECSSASCCETA